jgi:hypothetical protein
MDKFKIEVVKQLAEDFNQFKKSNLQPAIAAACPQAAPATVRDWGESHCNLLSWYFGLTAEEKIKMQYSDYFAKLLRTGCCNEAGYLQVEKNKASKIFGVTQNVDYLKDFENVINPEFLDPNSFYQLKLIKPMHYMIAWVEIIMGKSVLMIADTHDRGYGVPAIGADRIDADHFCWLLKIGE